MKLRSLLKGVILGCLVLFLGSTSSAVFADSDLEELVKVDADYILKCQFMEQAEPAYGCINNVYGNPTWVVPRENAMAILGLIMASEILEDASYLERAQLAADYLVRIQQEDDGAWCDQYSYSEVMDWAKSPTQTAEVMMAFYKLGYREDRYDSMKKGAAYLISCQKVENKGGNDDGLLGGGKDASGNYRSWRWASDNAYAYQALKAAEKWAMIKGDIDFREVCGYAARRIIQGIDEYLYIDDPASSDFGVWHRAIDENGISKDAGLHEWINYAPQMLDLPCRGVNSEEVGEWIHNILQKEDGAVVWNDGAGSNRKSPGFSFQAALCWFDVNQNSYADSALTWAKGSGLWQTTPDGNGVTGSWIDWTENGILADEWLRFIDTSFYSIAAYNGGYDFNVNQPLLHEPTVKWSQNSASVELNWDEENDSDFSFYRIYRTTTPQDSASWVQLGSDISDAAITTLTDNSVDESESIVYYYRLHTYYTSETDSTYSDMEQAIPVIYVDVNSASIEAGGSRENPYKDLSDMQKRTTKGTKVCVAQGTYQESVYLSNSLILEGGYEAINWTRDTEEYPTTVDAAGSVADVFYIRSPKVKIEGFTITGSGGGAGIKAYHWPPQMEITIKNCKIIGNQGHGISCSHLSGRIENCVISQNTGVGIYVRGYSSITIFNNLIVENNEEGVRCSVYALGCDITNNTIVNNKGTAGIDFSNGGDSGYGGLRIKNNIVVGNSGYGIYGIEYPGIDTEVAYNNAWNNANGDYYNCGTTAGNDNNISEEPLFIAGSGGDYYLSQIISGQAVNSPCIDTGSDTADNLGFNYNHTTRTDAQPDANQVDMGYHYFDSSFRSVVINEFLVNPDEDNVEWVELYNRGTLSVDISGCWLDDIIEGGGNPIQIPEGTIIGPGEFCSITLCEGDGYLNNSGDTVNFSGPDGPVIDSKSYDEEIEPDSSVYRFPDGGEWAEDVDNTPTRDTANHSLADIANVVFPTDLSSTANRAKYLIITADIFYQSPSLLNLANHRANYSDFDVAIVRLSDIYAQFPQDQPDKSIKDFISYAYSNWREEPEEPLLEYILLVGDADKGGEAQDWFLPAHFAYVYTTPTWGLATDNYYVSLNDNNGDGNVDDWDNIPDLKIGRFPIKTEDELTVIVTKTVNYELYNLDGDWLKHVYFIWGEIDAEIPHHPMSFVFSREGWVDVERNLSQAHKEITEKLGFGYDSPQEVVDIVDEGVGLLLYRGHGSRDELSSLFSTKDIVQLSNAPYYPIVLALCCSTGRFHDEEADCIGEELLLTSQKGCVAFFGASSGAGTWEDNHEAIFYSQAVFADSQKRLGDIIFDEKSQTEVFNEHRQIYNLLGDPALDISKIILNYSDKPDLALSNLQFSNSSPVIGDQITLTVSVENLGLTGVSEARVRFFKGDPDAGGIQIGDEHVLALSAESLQLIKQDWTVDQWGDFYLYAHIEAAGALEELCSENNKIYLKTNLPNTCMSGWPKQVEGRIDKINVADIDLNYPGEEIIAVSTDGRAYLWHGDGSEASGWEGGKWLDGELHCQPAIADLDSEYPGLEIVIPSNDRRIFAFHADGTEMLTGSKGVFAILDNLNLGYPAIADIDKDYPGLEVICTGHSGKIYAFHADGTSMFEEQNGLFTQLPDGWRIRKGATLADIDLNGKVEIIVISCFDLGGPEKVFVFNVDGQAVNGWEGGIEVSPKPNSSPPAIAEVDPNYPGLEIVIGVSGYSPITVLHADGTFMTGWDFTLQYDSRSSSNVTVGNFDPYYSGPEILLLRDEMKYPLPDCYRLCAFHYDGTALAGWEDGIEVPIDSDKYISVNKFYFSLADIDGDEEVELIVACGNGLLIAWNNDGTRVSEWNKKRAGYFLYDAPSIADIDGNGTVDLAIGSLDGYCSVWDLGVPINKTLMDWPLWRQNPQNTGCFNPGNRAPEVKSLSDITVNEGEPVQFVVEAVDLNFDALTYSTSNLPPGANFDAETKTFTWIPTHEQKGMCSNVHFEISDGFFTVSEDITITVTDVDTAPPTISIDSVFTPTNQDVTLTYTVEDNSTPQDKIVVTSDDGPPYTYTEEGDYTITLTATDEAGNSSSSSVSFTIDRTAPQVAITNPANNSGVSEAVIDISGTIDDDTATVEVEVTGAGTNYSSADNMGDGTFSASGVTIEGDGRRNIVKAIATDTAGNVGEDSISVFQGWVLHIDLPEYYAEELLPEPYNFASSGAASAQMIIDLMRPEDDTPSQLEIYEYGHAYNELSIDEMDPHALDYALGHYDYYDPTDPTGEGNSHYGYNFGIETYEGNQFKEYLRDITHWMAYPVTKEAWWRYRDENDLVDAPNIPACVPAGGRYNHWVVINGAAADKAPFASEPHSRYNGPWNLTDFTVYGLWLTDPQGQGIGQDNYLTAIECQDTTLLPLESSDDYDNKYLQVAEPPSELSDAEVSLAEPRINESTRELVRIANYLSGEGADPIKKHLLDKALVVDFNEEQELISYTIEEDLLNIFEPENEATSQINWKEIIDPSLLTDEKFTQSIQGSIARSFIPVKRLDKPDKDYYLIPFDSFYQGQFLSYAAIIIDREEGYFKQASWVDEPVRFIQISKEEAIEKVLAQIEEEPAKIQAELVYSPELSSSPFYPVWRITTEDNTYYINQEGEER